MTGVFNVKKSAIWHAIANIYGASTVIIMDMLPWTAWIRYHRQAHQHAAKVTSPLIGIIGPHLGTIATTSTPTMIIKMDTGTVIPDLTHATPEIGVQAIMTLEGVAPDHFIDLCIVAPPTTEAQVHTTTAVIHHTADLHPTDIFPGMIADPDNTNPTDNITNQHKDLPQVLKQHLGNARTEDTSKSPLTTHPQNTTAQMIRIVTQRMI